MITPERNDKKLFKIMRYGSLREKNTLYFTVKDLFYILRLQKYIKGCIRAPSSQVPWFSFVFLCGTRLDRRSGLSGSVPARGRNASKKKGPVRRRAVPGRSLYPVISRIFI